MMLRTRSGHISNPGEFLISASLDVREVSSDMNRNLDMIQALGWNSLERTTSDWVTLFAGVDSRLEFVGTRTPTGSSVSLIEAVFRKGDA